MNAILQFLIIAVAVVAGYFARGLFERSADNAYFVDAMHQFYQIGKDSMPTVTAQSELRLSEHPSFTPDDVMERGYNYTVRQLGEAVYPYAKHFVTEDGVYIASVEVLKGDAE